MQRRPIQIAPSILCADWRALESHFKELEELEIDWIHCDVMDGRFVPNITLGPELQAQIHGLTRIPLDTHLMIEEPDRMLEAFVTAGSKRIAVHVEAVRHLDRTLNLIRSLGAIPAVALNPATPLSAIDYVLDSVGMVLVMTVNPGFAGQKLVPATLKKVAELKARIDELGLDVDIEVDGNVSFEHIPQMVAAGANVLVAGTSSLYKTGMNLRDAHRKLLDAAGT